MPFVLLKGGRGLSIKAIELIEPYVSGGAYYYNREFEKVDGVAFANGGAIERRIINVGLENNALKLLIQNNLSQYVNEGGTATYTVGVEAIDGSTFAGEFIYAIVSGKLKWNKNVW